MNREEIMANLKNLDFDEAISFQMHTRMFEILGYLSNITESYLPEEERDYLDRIKGLSHGLLNEIHLIIDQYKSNETEYRKNKLL